MDDEQKTVLEALVVTALSSDSTLKALCHLLEDMKEFAAHIDADGELLREFPITGRELDTIEKIRNEALEINTTIGDLAFKYACGFPRKSR